MVVVDDRGRQKGSDEGFIPRRQLQVNFRWVRLGASDGRVRPVPIGSGAWVCSTEESTRHEYCSFQGVKNHAF